MRYALGIYLLSYFLEGVVPGVVVTEYRQYQHELCRGVFLHQRAEELYVVVLPVAAVLRSLDALRLGVRVVLTDGDDNRVGSPAGEIPLLLLGVGAELYLVVAALHSGELV